MSTVAIFNGFGKYETNSVTGEKGITLSHGGIPFWLPFQSVAYIPDYTMREVDHDKSTPDGDAEGFLVYKTFRLSGERVAEELLETQIPNKNSLKGIIVIKGVRNGTLLTVPSGVSEDGQRLMTEVHGVDPTPEEVAYATQSARSFKEQIVQEYLQSKRERMAGGQGRLFPTGLIRVFMDELGVKDIDDLSTKTQNNAPTIDLAAFADFVQSRNAPAPAPQTTTNIPVEPSPAPQANSVLEPLDISALV